jgi:hypothetical protein
MASISPGITMNNLVKSVQERYSVNVSGIPKGKIESVFRSITEGRLPMPPLVLSEDKTLLIDRKSPLSGKDYKVLFNASSTKRQLFGLARKMHLLGFKELKKYEIVEQIKRKLQITGIAEPVLLQVKRKSTKVVSELPNNVPFNTNENINFKSNNNFKLNNNSPKNNNLNLPKNNNLNFKKNNNLNSPKNNNLNSPKNNNTKRIPSLTLPTIPKTTTSPIRMSSSAISSVPPSLNFGSPKINFGTAPKIFGSLGKTINTGRTSSTPISTKSRTVNTSNSTGNKRGLFGRLRNRLFPIRRKNSTNNKTNCINSNEKIYEKLVNIYKIQNITAAEIAQVYTTATDRDNISSLRKGNYGLETRAQILDNHYETMYIMLVNSGKLANTCLFRFLYKLLIEPMNMNINLLKEILIFAKSKSNKVRPDVKKINEYQILLKRFGKVLNKNINRTGKNITKRKVNTSTQTNNSKPKQNTVNNSKRNVNTNTQTNNSKSINNNINSEYNDSQKVAKNYEVSNTAPDGNCLFRSIVKGHSLLTPPGLILKENEEIIRAQKLREDVVNILCGNNKNKYRKELSNHHGGSKEPYSNYNYTNEKGNKIKFSNWERYCIEMKKRGTWGSEIELYFLPRILKRPIRVYQPRGDTYMYLPGYYEGLNDTNINKEPIRLLYNGKNHYNLLVRTVSKTQPLPTLKTSTSRKLEYPENQTRTNRTQNQTQATRTQKQQQQTSTRTNRTQNQTQANRTQKQQQQTSTRTNPNVPVPLSPRIQEIPDPQAGGKNN